MKYFILATISLLLLVSCASTSYDIATRKKARQVQSESDKILIIEATGIGKNNADAEKDALRNSVWFVLFNSATALVNEQQKKKFTNELSETFFAGLNAEAFSSDHQEGYIDRRKKSDGRVAIRKLYRVDKSAIRQLLEDMNIINTMATINSGKNYPSIMVLPAGSQPLVKLRTDDFCMFSAADIEDYFTRNNFNVKDPLQNQENNEREALKMGLSDNVEEDFHYTLAKQVGSEIYITFKTDIKTIKTGSNRGAKATIVLKAYRTSDARILGTKTGYGEHYSGDIANAIRMASDNASEKLFTQVINKWQEDLGTVNPVKVIDGEIAKTAYTFLFNIQDDLSIDEIEDLKDGVFSKLEVLGKIKTIHNTSNTLKLEVRVPSSKYNDIFALYREIRKKIKAINRDIIFETMEVEGKQIRYEVYLDD